MRKGEVAQRPGDVALARLADAREGSALVTLLVMSDGNSLVGSKPLEQFTETVERMCCTLVKG